MPSFAAKAASAAITCAAIVAGHGHTYGINVVGAWYEGYDPTTFPYKSHPPTVVGWTASDTDTGFVAPSAYASEDIICHVGATPAGGYASVQAGDKIQVYWSDWPSSHHGPVIDMLANCNGDCTKVNKTALEFFTIAAVGLIDDTTRPGKWATDTLIANNHSWVIQIPSELAEGNYVWRHEIIALHGAEESDGAQNYPQCFNLAVTGTGTLAPTGTLGEALYSESDAGILVDVYEALASYDIPGPPQIAAGTNLAQSKLAITGSSAAITTGVSDSRTATSTPRTATAVKSTSAVSSKSVTSSYRAKSTYPAAAVGANSDTTFSAVAIPTVTSRPSNGTSPSSSCKKRPHTRGFNA